MTSIYLICNKDGEPFIDYKSKDTYKRAWAFKNKAEAEVLANGQRVIEYKPVKIK